MFLFILLEYKTCDKKIEMYGGFQLEIHVKNENQINNNNYNKTDVSN